MQVETHILFLDYLIIENKKLFEIALVDLFSFSIEIY